MNYENLTKEELIAELKKLQLEKLQKSEHTIIHTPDGRYGWRAKREKEVCFFSPFLARIPFRSSEQHFLCHYLQFPFTR